MTKLTIISSERRHAMNTHLKHFAVMVIGISFLIGRSMLDVGCSTFNLLKLNIYEVSYKVSGRMGFRELSIQYSIPACPGWGYSIVFLTLDLLRDDMETRKFEMSVKRKGAIYLFTLHQNK